MTLPARVEVDRSGVGVVVRVIATYPPNPAINDGNPTDVVIWTYAPWNEPDPGGIPAKVGKVLVEEIIRQDLILEHVAMSSAGRRILMELPEENNGEDLHAEDEDREDVREVRGHDPEG